jgi:hypothetical protein
MSAYKRWKEVCRPEASSPFEAKGLCRMEVVRTNVSPLDQYLVSVRSLLIVAGTVLLPQDGTPLANAKAEAGRILLLGLVSEVERYFRDTLSSLVLRCPKCAGNVSEETIRMEHVLRLDTKSISAGLFSEVSFASDDAIRKQSERIAGFKIQRNSSLAECIRNYGHLCHLRHASIHAAGKMGTKNLAEIGANPAHPHFVSIDHSGFDNAANLCHSLVRAYNRELYVHIILSWMKSAILKGSWNYDKALYSPVYDLFRSKEDNLGPKTAYGAYQSLRYDIRRSLPQTPPK